MANTERPNFIKPDEQSTLVGYPTPGEIARNTSLDGQEERDKIELMREKIQTGSLRLGDVHEMLVRDLRERKKRHQDPSGLEK